MGVYSAWGAGALRGRGYARRPAAHSMARAPPMPSGVGLLARALPGFTGGPGHPQAAASAHHQRREPQSGVGKSLRGGASAWPPLWRAAQACRGPARRLNCNSGAWRSFCARRAGSSGLGWGQAPKGGASRRSCPVALSVALGCPLIIWLCNTHVYDMRIRTYVCTAKDVGAGAGAGGHMHACSGSSARER